MNRKPPLARLLVLFLPAILIGGSVAAAEPRQEDVLVGIASRFDPVPWAGNRYASAVFTSPASLGLVERPELLYGQLRTDGALDEENVFCVRSRGFGFATESFSWTEERTMRRYTVALARRTGVGTAVALAYTYHRSDDDDLDALSSWDAAFAWTDGKRLSLTGAGRNLFRTKLGEKKLGRIWEGALRVDAVPHRLGFFAQARWFAGDDWDEMVPIFGIEGTPLSFVTLRGRADTDGNQGLGIELLYGSASVGFHYHFTDGAEEGSFAYVKLHVPDSP